MTIYSGSQTSIEISSAIDSPSYAVLKGVRSVRWRIAHASHEAFAVHEDNWARHMDASKRSLDLTCELYGASHTAQARIKAAALGAGKLRVKIGLAGGTTLDGELHVESYEELAAEDDVLEVEVRMISVGQITIT